MEENGCWRSAALRFLAGAVRSIPLSRGKMRLFGRLLALNPAAFRDYQFVCRRGFNLVWSSRGLPDLLTQHMLLDGFYQREVMLALRHLAKPGRVVLDVGAHHGLMSVVSALTVGPTGQVVAFEPNPLIQDLLRHHLAINRVVAVKLEECGVGDCEGRLPFYARSDAYAWNSSFTRKFADAEGKIEPVQVPVTTIDAYVERTKTIPNIIKIDTEGTEMKVLRGAQRTLQQHRPKVIQEINPSSTEAAGLRVADYLEYFKALNYGVFVLPNRTFDGNYRIARRFEEATGCPSGNLANVVCIAEDDPDRATIVKSGL